MIWSHSYANKPEESVVAMEERCLWERHIGKGDAKSLFTLALDNTPLPRNLEGILTHRLHEQGLVGSVNVIVSRLKEISSYSTEFGILRHPPETEVDRSQLHPCSFFIKPNYENDLLGRWQKLADIEVELVGENFSSNFHIYLIPSGLATPLLRHSLILKTDPSCLEHKRRVSAKFAKEWMERELRGFWFFMRKGGIDIPTVYSPKYDAFLNSSLQE